uniref:Ig-like domain-containing protein n=1 Tax=Sus scrofa TaxID=9823 RepID=A0A8D0PDC1_PIG
MIWLFQSLTLVFCLDPGNTVSQTSSTPLIVNGTLGESVTLPLKFPEEEKIMSITWLHDGKSIIFIRPNKAQSPLIHVTDPKQSNRLNVTKSYSLQLSNLTMADTGSYTAQITTTSVVFYSYYLRIFRRLGNLQVVTLTERSRNETCVIHLTCSVEDPNDNVSFSWQVSGSMLPSEANLTVSWDPKNFRDEIYMCIAENPVSNASSSVSVQSLCKGVINAKNVHLDTRWIIMVVPLICIVIFACLCVRRKKLADVFHFPAQQTQGAGAETVRNLEYASFSSGNTVYAQVTHANQERGTLTPLKNNDSTTIYTEVHQSGEKAL